MSNNRNNGRRDQGSNHVQNEVTTTPPEGEVAEKQPQEGEQQSSEAQKSVTGDAVPEVAPVPEVTTTTAAPEATLVPDTTQVNEHKSSKKQEASSKSNVFEERVEWVKEHGTISEKHVVESMERYVAICSKTVDLNSIAVEQQRMWRLFEFMHNNPKEFVKLFGLVLMFARQYKDTVFSMIMLFRAQSSLNLSVDVLVAYNNLRTLIINSAQTVDLSKVKMLVDIRKIVEHDSIPEEVRGMYVSMYA